MTYAVVTEKYVTLTGGPGQTLVIRPTPAGVSVSGDSGLIGVYEPASLQGTFDAVMALMVELYPPPPPPPEPPPATP
jgi:hypothetical protein